MNDNACYGQPAYILKQINYRESSLLLDVLTRDFGRISLIAKGVRKVKSKTAGVLRPFHSLTISFIGKSELKTLADAELKGLGCLLEGMALYCGFYVNELITHFLQHHDAHPELFDHYELCLKQLAENKRIEIALRNFELNLLTETGYGLHLGFDISREKNIAANKKYLFNKENGMIEDVKGTISGATLLAMQNRNFEDPQVLAEAKQLMRTVIDAHLQGKPIKSRTVMQEVFKRL
jgi:DNA repair protein RecO (recombination protein O)